MSLMSTLKGMLGEGVINIATWLMLDKEIYHRLNNITLPLENDGSTQIDHIIVSIYGIFVIETKNYKGWIYGNEKQAQWTQTLGGKKYKFQNPLRQNYLHVKTLSQLLDLDMSYFHSVVMFIGECQLKTKAQLPDNVMNSGLGGYIKQKQQPILTKDQVDDIVKQIETQRFAKSWRTNTQHKAYLKNKHSSKTTQIASQSKQQLASDKDSAASLATVSENQNADIFLTPFETTVGIKSVQDNQTVQPSKTDAAIVASPPALAPTCPKCASPMTKRVAKSGQRQGQAFWGCSKFPKCRGTLAVLGE